MNNNNIWILLFFGIYFLFACNNSPSKTPIYQPAEIEVMTISYASVPFVNPAHYWENKIGSNVFSNTTKTILDRISHFSGMDLRTQKQNLKADLYLPPSFSNRELPLLIFAHGGAFIQGSRKDIVDLCKHFATYDMIVMSIDYRQMSLLAPSYINASYAAMQDMIEALLFISVHAETYNLKTNNIYLGGLSAGSIVALHTAFYSMQSEQKSVFYQSEKLFGAVVSHDLKPKAVINIAGGIYDLAIIDKNIPVISFHCSEDNHVPFNCDLPFPQYAKEINAMLQNAKYYFGHILKAEQFLEEAKFKEICGSQEIHNQLKNKKIPNKLVSICKTDIMAKNGKLTLKGQQVIQESILFLRSLD